MLTCSRFSLCLVESCVQYFVIASFAFFFFARSAKRIFFIVLFLFCYLTCFRTFAQPYSGSATYHYYAHARNNFEHHYILPLLYSSILNTNWTEQLSHLQHIETMRKCEKGMLFVLLVLMFSAFHRCNES